MGTASYQGFDPYLARRLEWAMQSRAKWEATGNRLFRTQQLYFERRVIRFANGLIRTAELNAEAR